MDLRALHAFRLIAETGSISAAASALGTAQSALSARIRRLEEAVGAPLLERLPRGVRLTAAGQRLLPFAQRLEQVAAEALAAVRTSDVSLDGPFRLGAIEIAAAAVLPGILGRLLKAAPGMDLRLRTGVTRDLAAAVARGDLDAAVFAGWEPVDGHLVLRPLLRLPLALVRPAARPVETLDQAFVFAPGCVCRARLEALLLRRKLEMRLVELGSVEAMLGCVAAGAGIALLPASLCTGAALVPETAGALDLSLLYRREAEAKADALARSFRTGRAQAA